MIIISMPSFEGDHRSEALIGLVKPSLLRMVMTSPGIPGHEETPL